MIAQGRPEDILPEPFGVDDNPPGRIRRVSYSRRRPLYRNEIGDIPDVQGQPGEGRIRRFRAAGDLRLRFKGRGRALLEDDHSLSSFSLLRLFRSKILEFTSKGLEIEAGRRTRKECLDMTSGALDEKFEFGPL